MLGSSRIDTAATFLIFNLLLLRAASFDMSADQKDLEVASHEESRPRFGLGSEDREFLASISPDAKNSAVRKVQLARSVRYGFL